MFKKSILVAMALVTSTQSFAAFSSESGDSFSTTVQKSIFEFVYFGASPLIVPVAYLFELKDRVVQKNTIVEAADDMAFFAAHALSSEPGEYGHMYKKVVVIADAKDVVTAGTMVLENGVKTLKETTVENTSAPMEFNDYSAVYVKINGRLLISDKLAKAHEAAKNLIYDGVITVPEELRSGGNKENVWTAANTVVISNKLALELAKKEINSRQRILNRTK